MPPIASSRRHNRPFDQIASSSACRSARASKAWTQQPSGRFGRTRPHPGGESRRPHRIPAIRDCLTNIHPVAIGAGGMAHAFVVLRGGLTPHVTWPPRTGHPGCSLVSRWLIASPNRLGSPSSTVSGTAIGRRAERVIPSPPSRTISCFDPPRTRDSSSISARSRRYSFCLKAQRSRPRSASKRVRETSYSMHSCITARAVRSRPTPAARRPCRDGAWNRSSPAGWSIRI